MQPSAAMRRAGRGATKSPRVQWGDMYNMQEHSRTALTNKQIKFTQKKSVIFKLLLRTKPDPPRPEHLRPPASATTLLFCSTNMSPTDDGSNCREAKRSKTEAVGIGLTPALINDCLSSEFASYLDPSSLANLATVSKRLHAVAQDTARLFVDGASDDAEKEVLKPLLDGNRIVSAYRELVLRRSSAHDALLAAPAVFAKPGDQFSCWGEGMKWQDNEPVTLEFVGRNDVSPGQIGRDGDNANGVSGTVNSIASFHFFRINPHSISKGLPHVGWLVFKQADNSMGYINQCSNGIRDALVPGRSRSTRITMLLRARL